MVVDRAEMSSIAPLIGGATPPVGIPPMGTEIPRPFAGSGSSRERLYRAGGKRLFDLIIVLLLLPVVLPLYLVITVAILLVDGRPIHFRSPRVGADGTEFPVLKFRTMQPDAPATLDGILASDPALASEFQLSTKLRRDPRVTGLGRLLRRWSLDEVPQFLNVLRGDMSIVGPRPVTSREWHEYYGEYAALVFGSRPGLTGLWQVSGRSLLSYEERIELDLAYTANCRLLTDVSILAKTLPSVVRGRGAF